MLAPPGYSQTAAWATPVTTRTSPVLIDATRIAAVDDTGNLVILDTTTGLPTWRGSGAPTGRTGVTYSHVDGRPVLASATSRAITLWSIDRTDGSPVPSRSITIPSRATVSYLGSAPLIDLGDQTAALVTGGQLVRLDVPVTATPVLATQASVVAANSEHIWTITTTGTQETGAMPKPDGATGEPDLISAANDSTLIVLWPTQDTTIDIATLVHAATGSLITTARVQARAATERSTPKRSVTSATLALGSLFVDYGITPAIVQLDGLSDTVVDGNTVYGLKADTPTAAIRTGNSFTTETFSDVNTNDRTVPAAVTGSEAFVVATKVESTYLYALPRTTGGP
ncbi:hypothetical protein C5C03_00470 [Clavibacter michiganensis]|nr:hypothetical protein C5C03_00470 [Clavibacter michiganensis]PPF99374.1 hypothetical protein C5C05_02270 [Clavibacter michiganensis]